MILGWLVFFRTSSSFIIKVGSTLFENKLDFLIIFIACYCLVLSLVHRFTAPKAPSPNALPQVLHRLQNKEKPIRTTFTLRFGSLKMIFECSIARCDVGLGRAIVQCQKNPLRKPKLSINRAILSAHFSAVKFCIGFFCWIGFFWFCIGFFCNWMLQLLLKIVAKNLNYASLHVCT